MHVLGSLTLLHLRERGISVEKQLRAQYLLDESCLRMMEGQYLDISYESRLDIGISDYLDMIDKKTAALISCSLEIGALLGNDDESLIRAFRNLGRDMGIAFQIRDDILGIWGNEKETGKLLTGDIQRRKKSLPIVYALEKAEGEMKGEMVKVYQDQVIDPEGVATVLRILAAVEAQLYAQGIAEEYRDRALAEIERTMRLPWARHSLEELAHFLVKRKF
jgi:geranylgeranyl diphosphate synthase type I